MKIYLDKILRIRILILEYNSSSYQKMLGYADLSNNDFRNAANKFSSFWGTKFSAADIFKINSFFHRNRCYQNSLLNKDTNFNNTSGFTTAHFIEEIEWNDDSVKNLIIRITGGRFIEDTVLCLDGLTHTLLNGTEALLISTLMKLGFSCNNLKNRWSFDG